MLRAPSSDGRLTEVIVLVAIATAGCKSSTPQTVEAAHAELTRAAKEGNAVEVYRLLDRKTSWSIISAFKAKREIRDIVSKHYPPARRARELRRTQIIARAGNAAAYFVELAKQERLLAPLASAAGRIDAKRSEGSDRVVVRAAGQRLAYCREEKGWKYCGLRALFEQRKVRAARDLALVKENAETFKKGR